MRAISQNDRKLRNRRKQIDFILQQSVPGDLDDVLEIVRLQADGFTTEDAIRHVANEDDLSDLEREKFAAELSPALALNAELDGASDDLLWKRYEEAKSATAHANDAAQFFNLPGANADFQKWARKPYWTPEEAAALLLGKAPEIVNLNSLQRAPKNSPFRKEYEEHFDLIERAIAIGPLKQPIAPADLLTWAKARDIEYPKALDELLSPNDRNAKYQELLEENEFLRQKVQELEPNPRKGSIRERNNLLKIIIAAAVFKYTYMPSKNKNIAPERIASDINECGLKFTSESIGKKLEEASSLLSDEFKTRLKKVGLSGILKGE